MCIAVDDVPSTGGAGVATRLVATLLSLILWRVSAHPDVENSTDDRDNRVIAVRIRRIAFTF